VDGGGNCEPSVPIVLRIRREQSQVLFYPLIFSLGESVRLWVVSRAEISLCLDSFCQFRSKRRCEAGISIGDDAFGESEPSIDVVEVQLSNFCSCDRRFAGEEQGCPCAAMVYYREDCIVAIAFR
jgi:hypothetical protein